MKQTTAYASGAPRGHTFGRVAILPAPVQISQETLDRQDGSPDWDEALLMYEAYCQASALSNNTVRARLDELRLLRRYFDVKPAQITFMHLLSMQNRAIAASSKQRNRSVYQMFFRWLHEEEFAPKNAAARLPKVKVPRRAPRPFSVAQLERMLEVCRNRTTRTYILLGAFQGMRVAEIARMRGEMFDLDSNHVRFISKGGIERDMEIHPIVRGEIAHYPRHGYWFPAGSKSRTGIPHVAPRSVGTAIHLAVRRAGIDAPELTAHSLRHFFGTQLLSTGTDIRVVQELMGHQQLSSTAQYTFVSNQSQREGLARLPEVTLPSVHFSRRHRRAWLSLDEAATLLNTPTSTAARLAQEHSWRYTADEDRLVYAVGDVEASGQRLAGSKKTPTP